MKKRLAQLSLSLLAPLALSIPSGAQNFAGESTKILAKESQQSIAADHQSKILMSEAPNGKTVLILHGLHESPKYMQSLAREYSAMGYHIVLLRLPGHQALDRKELNKVRAEDWIEAAESGFRAAKEISPNVEILGYSTGGTLAAYLSLAHPREISRMILIAPALALSNRVFLSTLSLGWTGLDSDKICGGKSSHQKICDMVKKLDSQIAPMVDEKILSSLHAGREVQRLIDLTLEKFGPAHESPAAALQNRDYYGDLMTTFNQITTPIGMINSEKDVVVNWRFNQGFIDQFSGAKKQSHLFSKDLGISHLMINKGAIDAFATHPELSNSDFGKISEMIHSTAF